MPNLTRDQLGAFLSLCSKGIPNATSTLETKEAIRFVLCFEN
jgi:hypothetical protein